MQTTRHKRLLDREKRTLRRLHLKVKRMTAMGFSRKYVASQLRLTVDDVWELQREVPC